MLCVNSYLKLANKAHIILQYVLQIKAKREYIYISCVRVIRFHDTIHLDYGMVQNDWGDHEDTEESTFSKLRPSFSAVLYASSNDISSFLVPLTKRYAFDRVEFHRTPSPTLLSS